MEEAILVIGDHAVVRSALCQRLEMAFPHHQILEAAGGDEAVATLLIQSPRVVIIDIGAQAMKQLEVARRIKAVQPSVQIMVWTIHDWENYRADALAAGATAYVLKEETQNELLTVLTTMLAARPDSFQSHINEGGGNAIIREA
jgi:DNA-binding NarL/FixJ family response regulator